MTDFSNILESGIASFSRIKSKSFPAFWLRSLDVPRGVPEVGGDTLNYLARVGKFVGEGDYFVPFGGKLVKPGHAQFNLCEVF